jgi:carbonic anhydrase/acetyltransferase-like protein (isoleucine patch superfamily)
MAEVHAHSDKASKGLSFPRQLSPDFKGTRSAEGSLSGDQLARHFPGVSFQGKCSIDPNAAIGAGTVIADSVVAGANTVIGKNVKISHSQVENSYVGDDVTVRNANILDTTVKPGSHVSGGHLDKCTLDGNSLVGEKASLVQARVNNSKVFGAVAEADLTDSTVYAQGAVWNSQLMQVTVSSEVCNAKLTKSIVRAPVSSGEHRERDFG